MKQHKASVKESGLTVIYEPNEPSTAVADIVFVSGLGGHPVRTWQFDSHLESPRSPKSFRRISMGNKSKRASLKKTISNPDLQVPDDEVEMHRQLGQLLGNPSFSKSETKLAQNRKSQVLARRDKAAKQLKIDLQNHRKGYSEDDVYWPLDLLPISCPNTRIMTWGCQVRFKDGRLLPTQNNIFSHADELLHDIATHRDDTHSSGRAIIFVAHSLGGLMVKEMLRRSDGMGEPSMRDVVHSTLAVIFMGCPHRDSQHGRLGDAVVSMASAMLQVDARDPILQDLSGANSAMLNLAKQSFARLWNDYNFRVRTFQEMWPLGSTLREKRPEHVLRREASSFGDPRERAEIIDGSHLDMCAFRSAEDTSYRSLTFTIVRFVGDEFNRRRQLSPKEIACFKALIPPRMGMQHTDSSPGSCLWLYDVPEFRAWHHRVNGARSKLLWIKGRPGSGKSVLLRSLRSRVEKQWGPLGSTVIWSTAEGQTLDSVFFPGTHHHQSESFPAGVYRSLLAQLFRQDPRLRNAMVSMHKGDRLVAEPLDDADVVSFFADHYIDQEIETPTKRTFIFVDAADHCGVPYLNDLLCFLSQLATNSDYSICVSSVPHPDIVIDNAVDIVMHQRNSDDITRYISLNLMAEWEDRNATVVKIGHRAGGCFLWAEIVVNILNSAIEEGASQQLIEHTVMEMPDDLDGLYEWLFTTMGREEKAETLALMQWVILSSEPPRLNDLRVALRLTKAWCREEFKSSLALDIEPATSLRELRRPVSEGGSFETPPQFHRWLRNRSIGLLELRPESYDVAVYEPLGLQRVHVVHESVRTFFLRGRGFACLSPEGPAALDASHISTADLIDDGHFVLLNACLNYLNMNDFEPLGNSKLRLAPMTFDESKYWRRNARDQRHLVMASYPLLQYAAENLLYHMLSPRPFRYYLPQTEILHLFTDNDCRLWQRWTALMALGVEDVAGMLALCAGGSTGDLLSPVFGARSRLERVLRKVSGRAVASQTPQPEPEPGSPKTEEAPSSLEPVVPVEETPSEQSLSRPSSKSSSTFTSSTYTSPNSSSTSVFSSPIMPAQSTPATPLSFQSERMNMSPIYEKLPDLSVYNLVSHVR